MSPEAQNSLQPFLYTIPESQPYYPNKTIVENFISLQAKELEGISIRIGVDGEGGSGKGNLTSQLGETLHLPYFDSGKYYRAITAVTSDETRERLQHDETALKSYLDSLTIDVQKNEDNQTVVQVTKNIGTEQEEIQDVSAIVGTDAVSKRVSSISTIEQVREKVHGYQEKFMTDNDSFIIEGRDMYIVAAERATFMIYLHAEEEEILIREMKRQNSTLEEATKSALERTRQDEARTGKGKLLTREQAYSKNSPYDLCIDTSFIPPDQTPLIALNELVKQKDVLRTRANSR